MVPSIYGTPPASLPRPPAHTVCCFPQHNHPTLFLSLTRLSRPVWSASDNSLSQHKTSKPACCPPRLSNSPSIITTSSACANPQSNNLSRSRATSFDRSRYPHQRAGDDYSQARRHRPLSYPLGAPASSRTRATDRSSGPTQRHRKDAQPTSHASPGCAGPQQPAGLLVAGSLRQPEQLSGIKVRHVRLLLDPGPRLHRSCSPAAEPRQLPRASGSASEAASLLRSPGPIHPGRRREP